MPRLAMLILSTCLAACERAEPLSAEQGKQLMRSTGCTNCHDKQGPLVGPSFAAVAARYAGRSDAEAVLVKSLEQGSSGKWGSATMMPPQGRLAPEEKRAMIRWILSLSPGVK